MFTIYQITNLVNGKIYIGKHQTNDLNDGYLGSGKMIRRAVEKYGFESFSKDILHVFDTEDEMNAKEKELVTEQFCKLNSNYNLCPGGNGGFGYLNSNGLSPNLFEKNSKKYSELGKKKLKWLSENDPNWRQSYNEKLKTAALKNVDNAIKNLNKASEFNKGAIWINNGLINKKIKKDNPIPDGFVKGRMARKSLIETCCPNPLMVKTTSR